MQYEIRLNRWQFSAGARYENYRIEDRKENGDSKTGNVLSPRVTAKFDALENLQFRVSYSQGYRAPQIFDEDLHIETSGSRQVIHRNSPNLKQETSHSFMASADYSIIRGKTQISLLAEGFYTLLTDAFVNQIGSPDSNGIVIYTRINTEAGASVRGINLELNVVPNNDVYLTAGFTFQKSSYEEAQEFDEKSFLRTPDSYGFLTMDWSASKKIGISLTGNYTGKMLIPYFGPLAEGSQEGELRESKSFFDAGIKIKYNIKLNGATLQIFAGVKNIFNSYQDDFDYGVNRDPGYVYGPMEPRTAYAGIKIGNFIK